MVHDATGRADHNVCALAKRTNLAIDGSATINRDRTDATKLAGETVHLLADLHGELASRAENQHLCLR